MAELIEEHVEEYFRDARERHAIYLRRRAGQPRPWTQDPVLRDYKITNVFRELDKTTVHLRDLVREPLRDHSLVLPATVLYRWFTLISSGNTIFAAPSFLTDFAGAAGGGGSEPVTFQ